MKVAILITVLVLYKLITGAPGDVDGDGKLTLKDCKAISSAVAKGSTGSLTADAADIDGDKSITILDAMRLHQHLGGIWQDPAGRLPFVPEINEAERSFLAGFEELNARFEGVTPQQFIDAHPVRAPYGGGPDVTKAAFFSEVNKVYNLSEAQLTALKKNGFIILPPERAFSGFGEVYRTVFKNDLPVYVSSDALLEPLFRSYDNILKAVELKQLIPQMTDILQKSLSRLEALKTVNAANPAWQLPLQDAAVYLRVAQALLKGEWTISANPAVKPEVEKFLTAISKLEPASVDFFDVKKLAMDFSQFKPRGHYECGGHEKSCVLGNYFRTMMWLGRADCALRLDSLRQFRAFALIHDCLAGSGAMPQLDEFNELISFFVGDIDGFSPEGLSVFWSEYADRPTLTSLFQSEPTARSVMKKLSSKDYGNQFILSQAIWKRPDEPRPELPKIAQLSGQRFILDSYLLGRTVEGYVKGRNKPYLEEVAFCLGNNAAMNVIKSDISQYTGRMGDTYKPLHHRLGAARALFDAYPYWEKNLYTLWLDGLRELSSPLPNTVAAAMRTSQWQDKQMNTQMASWAQLRHNTILYAKQSYTMGVSCFYPDGYVEPYPDFYRRIGQIMTRMGRKVNTVISSTAGYFANWKTVTDSLAAMAERELKGLPLTPEQVAYLNVMLKQNPRMMCGGPEYLGWYPGLFYGGGWEDCVKAKPVIADVHTIPPSVILPANMVLHGATGAAQTIIINAHLEGADCGTLYAGPVFSYYQHDESPIKRLTDTEWEAMIGKGGLKQPGWIEKYK